MAGRSTGIQAGFSAALRVLNETDTEGDWDDPLVLACDNDVASVFEVWRQRYEMPVTDPRYLSATDGDVIRDMLLLKLADERRKEAADAAKQPPKGPHA